MRKLLVALCHGMACLVAPAPAFAIGEKYAEQGHRLADAIEQHLIEQQICNSAVACRKKLTMYGGHGNRINFSIYAPDPRALAALFGYLARHGMEVSGGVPISVFVYPASRESYGNIFLSPPAQIKLEINQ